MNCKLPKEDERYDLYVVKNGIRTKICNQSGSEIIHQIELWKKEVKPFAKYKYLEYFPKKKSNCPEGEQLKSYFILVYKDAIVY